MFEKFVPTFEFSYNVGHLFLYDPTSYPYRLGLRRRLLM